MSQLKKTTAFVLFILISTNLTLAMYDPHSGRFMQQDPLGIQPAIDEEMNSFEPESQYSDGINLFEYIQGNPVIGIDYSGLEKVVVAFEGFGGYNPEGGSGATSASQIANYIKPEVIKGGGTFNYYAQDQVSKAYKFLVENHIKKQAGAPNGLCYDTIIIIGWSYGGSAAHQLANKLKTKGIQVNAVITIDPVAKILEDVIGLFGFSKKPNVDEWYNYYQRVDKKSMGIPILGNPVKGADTDHKFSAGDFVYPDYAHVEIVELPTVRKKVYDVVKKTADWRKSNEYKK